MKWRNYRCVNWRLKTWIRSLVSVWTRPIQSRSGSTRLKAVLMWVSLVPSYVLVEKSSTFSTTQDVLHNENVKLDWFFKYSLLRDVVSVSLLLSRQIKTPILRLWMDDREWSTCTSRCWKPMVDWNRPIAWWIIAGRWKWPTTVCFPCELRWRKRKVRWLLCTVTPSYLENCVQINYGPLRNFCACSILRWKARRLVTFTALLSSCKKWFCAIALFAVKTWILRVSVVTDRKYSMLESQIFRDHPARCQVWNATVSTDGPAGEGDGRGTGSSATDDRLLERGSSDAPVVQSRKIDHESHVEGKVIAK